MSLTEQEEIANALHNAGLSALECPKSRSGDKWHDYRMKISEKLMSQGIELEGAVKVIVMENQ